MRISNPAPRSRSQQCWLLMRASSKSTVRVEKPNRTALLADSYARYCEIFNQNYSVDLFGASRIMSRDVCGTWTYLEWAKCVNSSARACYDWEWHENLPTSRRVLKLTKRSLMSLRLTWCVWMGGWNFRANSIFERDRLANLQDTKHINMLDVVGSLPAQFV